MRPAIERSRRAASDRRSGPANRRLLGDPIRSTSREWRYGRKGSLKINLEAGTWKDSESGEGVSVLDLIELELQTGKPAAVEWLTREGFLPGKAARRMPHNRLFSSGPTPCPSRKSAIASQPALGVERAA